MGYRVEARDLPDAAPGCWCDAKDGQVVVASGPANRQVRTLVHELAHALGLGYGQYGRDKAEVLVDSVVFWRARSSCRSETGRSAPCGQAGVETKMISEATVKPARA